MAAVHPSPLRRVFLWLPALAYAALIFHFSSLSDPLPAVTQAVWDKALHATEYAGLAVLLCRAWRGEGSRWLAACSLALAIASAYAFSDEWHQSFVAGRQSDVHDWLADTTGASLGVIGYWLALGRAWPRAPEPETTRYEHG